MDGHPTREVANRTGISQRTVSTILQNNKESVPDNTGGRPRKLPIGMAEYAKLMMLRGQVTTATAATKSLNQLLPEPVSVDTVRRGLREVGMKSEKVAKKPALNKK
ncbi:hypothetical protein BGZ80_000757 [Entomortierella chlamydospora]|uniref:Transposase Tc1-like domain-containing protein n=1 Tax=Entomortierella chlamydospora TaxID=101097 RepID=A0A9P6SY76_9FUNG|nr:hypothetical protein BGZ80_000757 [Entomortierella chlamydospora]